MSGVDKSFSARLSLNILLITSVLFVTAIAVAAISSHKLIADEATRSAQHLLNSTIGDIEKTLQGVETSIESSAWLVEEHKDDVDYLYHITTKTVEENPDIIGCAIAFQEYYLPGEYYFSPYSYVGPTGKIEQMQLGSPQNNYFFADWYQIPSLMGEPSWSEPYFDEGGAKVLMSTYSYPLKDESGKVYAVLTADIALYWMSDLLAEVRPYPSSTVSLVSRSGSFVTIGSFEELAGETLFSMVDRSPDKDKGLKDAAMKIISGESGVCRFGRGTKVSFVVYGPLQNGWHAYMVCDYKEVLARTSEMHMILILIGLLGLLILFILSYLTIRRLTKPLTEFSASALSIAEGNFNTSLPEIKHDDEIKQLRNSFEFMQTSLTEYIRDLKETTAANERFESELNIANNIQMSMLPKNFPHNDKIGMHAMLKPAREVGGDLYDFIIKDNMAYFTVGDVSGKGVPASMFMAITRSMIRFTLGMGLPLNEVINRVNNSVCDGNDTGMFVTLFIGSVNLDTGEFHYCNAGHNPVVVNGEFLPAVPNLAIGVWPDFQYQEQVIKLEKGTRIIIYTDGVTEAEREDKAQYGEERLLKWAKASIDTCRSAEEACQSLMDSVHEFTAGNAQNDDITIMTIKIK